MVDAILVYSPEKELEVLSELASLGEKMDWKPAIILSAAYLEKFGIQKLKGYFKRKSERARKKKEKVVELSGRLEDLSLPEVAILLYGLELIKPIFFTHMNQIWRERTKIVHPKGSLPAYVGEEANKKYGRMIRQALAIIQFLQSEKTK